jgi:hypothetical protein
MKWILIALNLVNAVYSTFIFLVFLGVPVYYWVFLNICAPIQFFTVAGLIFKSKNITSISIPMLTFFGCGGLFLFSWKGYMIQAQLNHILMTVTAAYLFLKNLKDKKRLLIGLSVGVTIVVLLVFLAFPVVMNIPEVMEIFERMVK